MGFTNQLLSGMMAVFSVGRWCWIETLWVGWHCCRSCGTLWFAWCPVHARKKWQWTTRKTQCGHSAMVLVSKTWKQHRYQWHLSMPFLLLSQRHLPEMPLLIFHVVRLPWQDLVIFLEARTDLICQYNLYYNAFLPETLEGIQRVPEELLPYLNRHTFMIDDIGWSHWVEAISRYTPLSWEDVPCFQGATRPFSPATQDATWDI